MFTTKVFLKQMPLSPKNDGTNSYNNSSVSSTKAINTGMHEYLTTGPSFLLIWF